MSLADKDKTPGVDEAGAAGEGRDITVSHLLATEKWLDGQLLDYQTAVDAADHPTEAAAAGDNKDITRISQLQKQLAEAATNNALKTTILERLHLGAALTEVLFPPNDAPPEVEEYTRKITELVDRQTELSKDIMVYHKKTQDLRKEIIGVKTENLRLKQDNRELMANLKQIRDSEVAQMSEAQQNSKVKKVHENIEMMKMKIELTRNIFQGLILGSGVNWAADPQLQELVLSLGESLDNVTNNTDS